MKKTLIGILAALVALSACEKNGLNETGMIEKGTLTTLTAESSIFTRTSMDGNRQLLWSAGDSISVIGSLTCPDGEAFGATGYALTSGAGTTKASFAGVPVTIPEGGRGYAVYPQWTPVDDSGAGSVVSAQQTAVIPEGIVRYIPRYQVYVPDGIPESVFAMAGSFDPADGKINFKPMSSVLEFKMYGSAKISQIEVYAKDASGAASKQICGNAYLIVFDENGEPSLVRADGKFVGGNAKVYLKCPDVALGADAEHATSFYIVVPGAASFNHLDITITNDDGSTLVKSTRHEDVTLTPGTIYSLPAFEVKFKKVLAKWANGSPGGIYDAFKIGASGATVKDKETPEAPASTGSGYIKFKNNDGSDFRTAYSSPSFVAIPATQGDEYIVAATNCSVAAGATIRLLANLWLYRNSTASTYELDFSTDGTNWTKLEDYTFTTVSTNGTTEGSHFDVNKTVKLEAAATNIFFRFLATNNVGPDGTSAPNSNGQTRLRPNKAENELAIYKE